MRSQLGWALAPTGAGPTETGHKAPAARRGRANRIAATTMTAMLAITLAPGGMAPTFAATPPTAPNNIVVFPQRDFVVLEGYQNRVGQFATITVTRGTTVTGRAEGQIVAGDPALEVNHPGGVCWGTGAGAPNITPNIIPGDVVSVAFNGVAADSARTQSPTVTGYTQTTPNTVVVDGTLGAPGGPVANRANLEQRIVAPDLVNTSVGRRDVRAGGSKAGSFTSSIAFPTASTFTATYTFADPAVARIAAAGQARALTWMATDADANRQGMTIAEFGELGGPGFGGCPAATPTAATVPTTPRIGPATGRNSSALVTWREQASGGSPLTGSWVRVTNSSNIQVGRFRPALVGDTSLVVTGLTNGQAYRFQVGAQNRVGVSAFSLPSNVVRPAATVASAPRIQPANPGTRGGAITARANWLGSVTNGGSAINGYVVTALRLSATGRVMSTRISAVQPATARSLSMTLQTGTHRFVVRARNGVGFSAYSARSTLVGAQ